MLKVRMNHTLYILAIAASLIKACSFPILGAVSAFLMKN